MANRTTFLALSLLTGLALALAGCGGDDTTSPGGQTGDLALDDSQAEEFTLSTLDLVNELVNSVPDFAAADFGDWSLAKSQSDSVRWDPAQQAYVFAFEGPVLVLDPPNSWTMSLGLRLQYRDAQGEPLQYPVGAVEMEVDYDTGMHMHLVDAEAVSDVAYETTSNLTVSYLGQGQQYGIQGGGRTTVAVSQIAPAGSQSGQFALDWTLDLTAAPEGCPAGTATVQVQGYTLTAVYDGQGGAAWTLTGPGYQASGNESLMCLAAES